MKSSLSRLRRTFRNMRQHTLTVYFISRHEKTPLSIKLLAALVAAYVLSPIDLLPDLIPIIGQLDELLLIPFALAIIIRLTPEHVFAEARNSAREAIEIPVNRWGVLIIIGLWLLMLIIALKLLAAYTGLLQSSG